jgi:hypothetical protein
MSKQKKALLLVPQHLLPVRNLTPRPILWGRAPGEWKGLHLGWSLDLRGRCWLRLILKLLRLLLLQRSRRLRRLNHLWLCTHDWINIGNVNYPLSTLLLVHRLLLMLVVLLVLRNRLIVLLRWRTRLNRLLLVVLMRSNRLLLRLMLLLLLLLRLRR